MLHLKNYIGSIQNLHLHHAKFLFRVSFGMEQTLNSTCILAVKKYIH